MSRPHPISDATADFLLAGGEVDDPVVQDLAQVLVAASAPGRAEELAGEDAAATAFTAAHLAPSRRRRRPMIKSMLVNALGLKLAAAALVAAVGGLAFAASTGVLPSPLHPDTSTKTPGRDGRNPSAPVRPTMTPSALRTSGPQLAGWCHAYLSAGSAQERNKHLTADLIAAAGGPEKVEEYCVALVGPPRVKPSMSSKPKPSERPSASAKPSASATPRLQPGSKGKPTVLPTGP